MTGRESYADEQRRRNGLTPAGYYVDECMVTEVDGTPVAVRGSGTFTERDREMFAEVVRAAKRRFDAEQQPDATVTFTADATAASSALDRLAKEFDLQPVQQPDHIRYALVPLADLIAACDRTAPRCPHTELPPAMCHHCKET